ncbi:chromate transporter [Paracoccus sp. (in: a-proteobacteria)]|uniref:chromate transporter n=1 Tax=Paracoccus sp. TaxID=267 RepID=UPI002AFE9198|nr:chromate transporter [Paracoccus sp. (in: a-proteobacteria)]
MTLPLDADPAAPQPLAVSPWRLFSSFALIGIIGFGGVMPWLRWLLVEKRRWCTEEEFLNLFALANFLPGGNVLNASVLIGARLAGFVGSVAAISGLVTPPAILVCAMGEVYRRYGHLPAIQNMLEALASAAAGLIVAMSLRMAWQLRRSPRAMIILGLAVFAAVILHLPLIWTLAILMPVSLLAAYYVRN